jgi:hypothetical protein
MDQLGCPAASLAVIWGIRSQSWLSQALRGNIPLDKDEVEQLFSLLSEMEQLAQSVHPLPIDWRSGSRIRDVLKLCRARQDFLAGFLALGMGTETTDATAQQAQVVQSS